VRSAATNLASIVLVLALGTSAGCGGGGGGGGNDNQEPGDPTPSVTAARTPSAVATHTPGAIATGHTPAGPTSTIGFTLGPTPVGHPTVTPSGAQTHATVTFEISASATVLGFQIAVAYPTAKGRFTGSAGSVQCSTPSRERFTKNHKDDGTLILSLAFPTALAFPVTISCSFDDAVGATLDSGDFTIAAKEVTTLSNDDTGVVGDPDTLTIAVGVAVFGN